MSLIGNLKRQILVSFSVLLFVAITVLICKSCYSQHRARRELAEMAAYADEGRRHPSQYFRSNIPEMGTFAEKARPLLLELLSLQRQWELGLNVADYKAAILKIGSARDIVSNVPSCYEAETLIRNAEHIEYLHKEALWWWNRMLDEPSNTNLRSSRDKLVNEALEKTGELQTNYYYIVDEIAKRK